MREPSDGLTKPDSLSREAQAVRRLKRRADFLTVARGRRWHGKALTLQMAPRDATSGAAEELLGQARVGFTLTKKVGCAVVRNRARRRLREAVRLSRELPIRADHDYVIIGRLDAVRIPFATLQAELARAVRAVHDGARGTTRAAGRINDDTKTADTKRAETKSARRADPKRAGLERTRPQS